jgi:tetratricopeptide (TPR) repeat protein
MPPVRAVPIALLALLVVPFALRAQPGPPKSVPGPAAASEWLRVESEHFTLFGNRPVEELVEAAVELERLRNVLSQIAPETGLDPFLPARLYLFQDGVSFSPFRLSNSGFLDAGYLIPEEETSYGAFVGGRPSYLVLKQYVHDLLHRQLPGLPAWLRHGFAEYYSTFEADDDEARIGLPVRAHLEWLRRPQAPLLPMAELLTAADAAAGPGTPSLPGFAPRVEEPGDEEGPMTLHFGGRNLFQGQSWAAVHYLMSGDDAHRRRVGDYIRRVQRGEDPVAAFRAAFATDLDAFDRALARYVRGESFTFLRVPVEARAGHALAARPLTPAETAFHLGDLLLRLGPSHRQAAGVRLRRAVELDPAHGPAWSALGRLAEESGDDAAALASYEKAAALAPGDFTTQLRYGRARLRSLGGRRATDEVGEAAVAAARAAFERAAALRPAAGEAWAGLGQAGVLANQPSPEAVAALEKALELLPPGRTDVLYNLLLARARLGDAAGVDRAAAELRAAGAGDELLSRAREVRLQLALQEAHRLATSDRLDDAVAVLAVVRAETASPALAEQAGALLETLSKAEAHNRFAERYLEAVRLYHAGQLEAAAAIVAEMRGEAKPGRQTETLLALAERIAGERPR